MSGVKAFWRFLNVGKLFISMLLLATASDVEKR